MKLSASLTQSVGITSQTDWSERKSVTEDTFLPPQIYLSHCVAVAKSLYGIVLLHVCYKTNESAGCQLERYH